MAEHRLHRIRYHTHPDVYDPSDDTELLVSTVAAKPGDRALDLGCGTGLVGIRLAQLGARVLCVDRNPAAVALARANAQLNGITLNVARADLTDALRLDRFDVVAFNPPYLPTTHEERVPGHLNDAFDGGADGLRTVERFFDHAARTPPRRMFVLGSTLQGPDAVLQAAQSRGMRGTPAAAKQLSFETLTVYDLSVSPKRNKS